MYQNNCSKYCPPTCSFEVNYCNYPVFCDDYDCTNPETCVQMIPSDCVTYEGNLFEQYGIPSGVTVTELITAVAQLIYPDCYTTTTTTTAAPCISYTLNYVPTPQGSTTFAYTTCTGVETSVQISSGFTVVCAQQDSVSVIDGVGVILAQSPCII